MSTKASQAADAYLTERHGTQLKGWIFHVRKNGRVLVDAPHGMARRVAVDGMPARSYDSETLVHIASVSKLICAVGILRFIEDWNEIAEHLDGFDYKGPARDPFDDRLIKSVGRWGARLSLDDKMLGFLNPHLPWIVPPVRPTARGLGIESIMIRDLLAHRSGLRDAFYGEGLTTLGLAFNQVKEEVTVAGKARFDLLKDCAVVCANDLVAKRDWYCNDGYTLLGALIELNAGKYENWIAHKLFNHSRFYDIARRPVDPTRACRYYLTSDGADAPGVAHPDYADFSAAGGYYTSARAICDWLDAVMQAEPINGRPILRHPQPLQDMHLGVGAYDDGPFDGFDKNGGTTVGQAGSVNVGGTNARIVFLRSISGDRLTAFVETNEGDVDNQHHLTDANPLLDDGLAGIRAFSYAPTSPPPGLGLIPPHRPGLLAHRWLRSQPGASATLTFHPAVETIPSSAVTATNLLAGADKPFDRGAVQLVELSGVLEPAPGTYKLRLTSDDGAVLSLDGQPVVDNGGRHAMGAAESAWITFPVGGRKLSLIWYNVGGGAGCYLEQIRNVGGLETADPVPVESFRTPRLIPL